MKIAILGWGSLKWDPRNLAYEGAWQSGGPQLPLEFSRISRDGRLTLVIDPTHGEPVSTLYTTSTLLSLDEAIENLQEREGTSSQYIGFINLVNGETYTCQNADLVEWTPPCAAKSRRQIG
jgi:hypothetical protein